MRALAVVLGLAVLGCGDLVCTLVTCADGFVLVVDGTLPDEYTVLLDTDGQAPAEFMFHCSPASCASAFKTDGVLPAEVEAVVLDVTATELGRQTFHPQYEAIYANGSRCGVTCRTAADTLIIS